MHDRNTELENHNGMGPPTGSLRWPAFLLDVLKVYQTKESDTFAVPWQKHCHSALCYLFVGST